MKKSILFLFFITFISTFCFSISNIQLYMEDETSIKIQNNKLYFEDELVGEIKGDIIVPVEDDSTIMKITEDTNYIILIISEEDYEEDQVIYKFSKKNGKLVYMKEGMDYKTYYEDTGLLQKEVEFINNKLFYSTEYFYDENGLPTKEIEYDENDNLDYYTIYNYDKKLEMLIDEISYDENDKMFYKAEYDVNTGKRLFSYEYENEKLVCKKIFDSTSGYEIERHIYNNSSNKPEIYKFLAFDKDNKYDLEDGYYLDSAIVNYYEIINKEYYENWNKDYSAKITKITFDKNIQCYKYIDKLIQNKKIFNRSFTLCNQKSNKYYVFNYTKDNKIDLNNCYEIQLIKKEDYYKSLNKSGVGKGPFGFDIGMTYEEVKAACNGEEPEHISDDRYYVKPINSHPMFDRYVIWISKKYGVYYVKGISTTIYTSEYGTEVKTKFNNLLTILEKKYGNFIKIDNVKDDYTWKDDKYWMQSIKDGARSYKAFWYTSSNNKNNWDGLSGIIIGIDKANSYSTTSAYYFIEYQFMNYDAADDLLNDVL